MKVAYATTFDPENPESWPRRHLGLYGAGAKIIQTLKTENVEIVPISRLRRKRSLISRCKGPFYKNVRKKNFYGGVDPSVAKHHARQIAVRLPDTNADILLCPENTVLIADVDTQLPIVLWTDTMLGSLIDFYPYLSNLCRETRRNVLEMEQRAVDKCSLIILSSQWAADQAHSLYGISPAKIRIIPRASNQVQSLSDKAFEVALKRRQETPCQLLFIGVDWQRKGGDTAFGTAELLNKQGIETELHIVGCKPPYEVPEFVTVHGFIERSTAAGQAKMAELFQAAHFLLFPTKADAMGVVISEAASFGVPALASNVGGVSSAVKTGVTGKMFSPESEPGAYCEFIAEQMEDDGYAALARSTFEHYKNYVSWSAVGKQAVAAFEELLRDQ